MPHAHEVGPGPARRLASILLGLSALLLISLAGEAVAQLLDLPFPGAVLGLAALLAALLSPIGDTVEEVIGRAGELLILVLPLLLVPLAVGVMDIADTVGDATGGLMVSLVVGWLVAFVVTVALYLPFRRRDSR